ncbi:hypothetical protein BX600DRAFT_486984 [Xylariales sp. PMI_506]|nr:hypothetical protein BX600DRAFT_486984 [Xylariales sp. PMI_506]
METTRVDFLRHLRTSPYEDRKNRNPKRADDTCEWFIAHTHFQNWQNERYLVDDIFPSNTSRTTCYFFFKDDFDDQKNPTGALCCILHQLFVQQRTLLSDEILDDFQEEGNQLFTSFHKLWDILVKAANRYKSGEIICILDALDECVDQKYLTTASTQLYTKGNGTSALKFLVTSRPYLQIQREFQDLKDKQPTIHLSGESEEEVDKIALEIGTDIYRKPPFGREEKQILQEKLTSINQRTYLWVHLIFTAIEDAVPLTKADIRACILDIPHTVPEAYNKILLKSQDPDKTKYILRIVVAADRPLHLMEMANQCHNVLERDLFHRDYLQSTIRQKCGLFVTIQEFLVPDQTDAHRFMAEICIRYLLLDDFKKPRRKLSPEPDNEDEFIFLNYAASNWADHYRKAYKVPDLDLERKALELCERSSSACSYWLKASEKGYNVIIQLLLDEVKKYQVLLKDRSPWSSSHTIVNQADSFGKTPLWYAAANGHQSIVERLLKKGAKVDSKDGNNLTPLFWAMSYGHNNIVKLLMKNGAQHDLEIRDRHGYTPLLKAAVDGNEEIMQQLLDGGAQVNAVVQDSGWMALMYASRDGHEAVVQLLRVRGAEK